MNYRLTIIMLLCISSGCISDIDAPRQTGSICYLYVSPDGNDANPGTLKAPFATLQRANDTLMSNPPDMPVVVRIYSNRGHYYNLSTWWTYYNPMCPTTLTAYPAVYHAYFVADEDAPPDRPFFTLDAAAGEPTNIHITRLSITNYVRYIFVFRGDRENPDSGWNGYNSIQDCIVMDAGNARRPDLHFAYGAIGLVNSRYNLIQDCQFINCANANPDPPPWSSRPTLRVGSCLPINGIYLAHYSSNNEIRLNIWENIRGDVIRLRDYSNENYIHHNQFYRAGWFAVVTHWYCIEGCTKMMPECPSWENIFKDNICISNWRGDAPVIFHDLRPENKGGCFIPIGYNARVVTD